MLALTVVAGVVTVVAGTGVSGGPMYGYIGG